MVGCTAPSPEVRVSQVDGWLCVSVPYEDAAYWQRYFQARGIGCTLIRDPQTGEASLDLWRRIRIDRVPPARG
jgi:hypothetical protein